MAFHLKFLFTFVVSRASATRAPSWGRLPSGSLPQSILKTFRNRVATLIDLEPFRTRVATLMDFGAIRNRVATLIDFDPFLD